MLIYIGERCLEQFGKLKLGQPNIAVDLAQRYLRAAILGGVENDLAAHAISGSGAMACIFPREVVEANIIATSGSEASLARPIHSHPHFC